MDIILLLLLIICLVLLIFSIFKLKKKKRIQNCSDYKGYIFRYTYNDGKFFGIIISR